jgi:hypothetical protein
MPAAIQTLIRPATSDGIDAVYQSAVGVRTGPEDLSLARLRGNCGYHFDLDQPLCPGVLLASRRASGAQFESPRWQRQEWHASQLQPMREPRPDS